LKYVNDVVFAEKNGDRRNVDNIIVLLTDGNPGEYDRANKTAIELKKNVKKVRKQLVLGTVYTINEQWQL